VNVAEKDLLAAEYVLGTLDWGERRRVADGAAVDGDLRASIGAWEQRLQGLAEALPPAPAPAGVWSRIEAALDDPARSVPGATTVYAEQGKWMPVADGIAIRILTSDPAAGVHCYLVRAVPGARLGGHPHGRTEECLVLEGDLQFGNVHLAAGDFHVVPAGVPHPAASTCSGCLLFIRGPLEGLAA
jgi:uncharacterized RmlC-like cupin family protein